MKCFYHNDADGRCAGSIVAQYTKNYNPDNYYEISYDKPFPIDKVTYGETVYIVDYSFTVSTVNTLAELIQIGCNLVWIDHHKSSIQLINNESFAWLNEIPGIRSSDLCGAALTYKYFYGAEAKLPKYIQYVDDYDRWVYKFGDDTIFFKLGVETMPYNALDDIWVDLYLQNCDVSDILETGKKIKAYIDIDNAHYLDAYGYESEISGYKCYVVNKVTNSWIFGDKINKYPVVVVWAFNGQQYKYSIFTTDDSVDCSEIAESYGGGGHKGAAGFQSDELLFTQIDH